MGSCKGSKTSASPEMHNIISSMVKSAMKHCDTFLLMFENVAGELKRGPRCRLKMIVRSRMICV